MKKRPGLSYWLSTLLAAAVFPLSPCIAQELEPRSFSPSPVGTNFLALGYSRSEGSVLMDPSLPIKDVHATLDTYTAAYSHTFGVLGRAASAAIVMPYAHGDVTGIVEGQPGEVVRDGIADMKFRLASNLIGGSAMTPEEFKAHPQSTVVGLALNVSAPTGEYTSEHLINIGANRWSIKPEFGASQTFGPWFVEASGAVAFFTDNHNFFGGQERSQDPITSGQLHGGYTFMPGLWLAGDATYYTGGRTSVDGKEGHDIQDNSRYGATLSVPLSKSVAIKFSTARGLVTRTGQDFTTYGVVLQYRWFNE